MARHAKNPTRPGLLLRRPWPFTRRRASPLDRLGPSTSDPKRTAAYRAIGVAKVPYLPARPLLALAGEYRAGCWS
ncbi:hypothetical protein ACFYPH_09830 [Micromonospora sp. NPDC005252]|uniref:hypothetical protein n=1 Tax=Micromonospora sp. NPDC005252 TaxID=3364228 RepID=UPI0036A4CDF2